MNRFLSALMLSSAALLLWSCGSDVEPTPEPEPEPLCQLVYAQGQDSVFNFTVDATTADVAFNCTDTWTARIIPEGTEGTWVSIYPHSGIAGDGKFRITVNANGTLTERDAAIEILYKDKVATIPLHQAALTRLPYSFKGSEIVGPVYDAYEEFIKTDLMPEEIKIADETLSKGYYYEAMCLLLPDLAAGGDAWKTKTYTLKKCSHTDNAARYETYASDEVTLEKVLWINEKQYAYAQAHGNVFANYCTVDDSYFSQYRSMVVCARIIHEFQKTGTLPDKVSSWQSDFLRNMVYTTDAFTDKYCDINDPAVVAARDAAIAGKTTSYDKVLALFEYARDKWEWIDYSNTHKGALTVIAGKEGNCCDLSHALIAIARSAGIPARYVHGPETYYPSGNVYGHVWAELYADGKWYVCDPSNNASQIDKPVWNAEKSVIRGKYRDLPF